MVFDVETRDLGRDRDPFERSLIALRRLVTAPDAVKGLSLPVLPLAAQLGVSSTPVREALAHLAGEGLITRSSGGYRTHAYDRESLSALYGLASLLIEAALGDLSPTETGSQEASPVELTQLPSRISNLALGAAAGRVLGQLAPFALAETQVLGEDDGKPLYQALRSEETARPTIIVRAHYRRRARRSGEILAAAMGL